MQQKRPRTQADRLAERAELSPALSKELWVRPNLNFPDHSGHLGDLNITPASAQRFLELADIALGLKKALPARKKPKSARPDAQQQKKKSTRYPN